MTFIHDLQGITLAELTKEVAKWTPAGLGITAEGVVITKAFLNFDSTSSYTEAQRTYSGIDPHEFIVYSFAVILSGNYNGDIFYLEFDGVQSTTLVATSLSTSKLIYIKGGVVHSGSTLTVKIVNKLGSSTTSLVGFREFTLNFYKTSYGFTNAFCHTLMTENRIAPKCKCGILQGGDPSGCVSCNPGYEFCGDNHNVQVCSKCDTTVSFIDWDGETCGSVCDQYCDKCSGGLSGNDCSECLTKYFIYGDGACLDSCPSPLVVTESEGDQVKTCKSPCKDSEWLYPNNMCGVECSGVFVEKIVHGIKHCENSCETEDEYIFRNKSCVETCSEPNEKEANNKLGKTCISPCDDPDDYYYTEKGVCEGLCDYPNEKDESGLTKLCVIGLDSGQIEQTKQVSKAVNGVNSGSTGAIAVLSFLSSSDSTSICMGAFSKMLQYIKYMDILYPAKVELMLEMMNSNSSSTGGFASKIMREVLDKFPERKLPEKFEYFGAGSSFFVNYWPSLFILLILFSVTVGFMLLGSSMQKSSKVNQIVGILKWNMVLLLFCGDFGDIVFFTAMELTTAELDSVESVLSLIVCIAINIFAFWVLFKILSVNFRIRESKLKLHEIEGKWGHYKTLFAMYKDQSYFQRIFLFIFIIRVSIFNAVIGYFFQYPLFQAILITLVNLSMLLYLISKRPMKAMINFIQQVVLEGFLLVFNVCLCVLASLDHNGIEAYEFRDSVGEVMVVMNLVVPIISVIILAAKFVIIGVEAYWEWKAGKATEKRDLSIEAPRRRQAGNPGGQIVKKTNELETSMANKSEMIDMSSSNVNFLNNSQPWINFRPDERSPRLGKPSKMRGESFCVISFRMESGSESESEPDIVECE